MSPPPTPRFDDAAVPLALLRERAFNQRWAEQPEGVIPLTAADPDFPAADVIREALVAHVREGVFSYGPPGGLPLFRETVARDLRQRRGAAVEPGGVMAVNSAAAGLALVARHWLQPGDEAIVWDPVDFLLPHTVRAAGGVPVLWPIGRHGPLDLDGLERLITPRTRLLCLCNPHNPLGRCFSRQELETLGRFCLAHGLRVLSDEVWSDIVYPPAVFTSWLALEPSLAAIGAVVQGFSKGFALAGLRVGTVAMADPEELAALLAASDQPSTVDGVATLSQVAAAAACSPEGLAWLAAFLDHLRRRRDQTIAALAAIPGLTVISPDATYVAFVGLAAGGESAEALVERLRQDHGLALVPGSPRWFGPGGAGHVRLCFATGEGILAEGLRRFAAGMAAAPPGRSSSG